MKKDFDAALKDIAQNREEIISKLMEFFMSDMLLFWGQEKDLIERQHKVWDPILSWAKQAFDTDFKTTHGLDIPEQDKKSGYRLKFFMENLSDKELLAFYWAAMNMRSVLLAAAFIKREINAEQAFEAAFIEEIWQSESWGVDGEAQKRRDELKAELKEIEEFLDSKK